MIVRLVAYLVVFSLQETPVESLKLHVFRLLNKPDFVLNINRNIGLMSTSLRN